MSALPEPAPPPELVDFPIPTKPVKPRLVLEKPTVDSILHRMNPDRPAKQKMMRPLVDDRISNLEQEEAELREQQREFARTQAESMERIRVAKEMEILLAARERVLDEREALLSERQSNQRPDQQISSLEKSLRETREAASQANKALAEKEGLISSLRAEIENLKKARPASAGEGSGKKVSSFDEVTDPSLADQVAFLKEREAFIEESENVLFDKAQHLQEWETLLQQAEDERAGEST